MAGVAKAASGIVAVVGWPQAAGAVVYNAASVLRDGAIEQTYRKRELPNYAVFDERRYFDVDPDREDCVFDVNGVPVGLIICEDLWFAEPIASTVRNGAQIVLVPNASPFERDKHAQRDALLSQRANESGAAIAYLNDFRLMMFMTALIVPLVYLMRAPVITPDEAAEASQHAVMD